MGIRAIRVLLAALATAGMTGLGHAAMRDAQPMPQIADASDHNLTNTGLPPTIQRCKRWRALASRLGETHAGYKLRHTVVSRFCAFEQEGVDAEVWSWPWRHQDVRSDLPPQRHGQFGAWEIRCGNAGPRRRCALALETGMSASLDPETMPLRIVSHIVIDTVAGRESVLWRVHVAPLGSGADHSGGIGIGVAGREASEPFDACGPRGCLAEADPRLSAEVASWLWSGKPVAVSLADRPGSAAALSVLLPADGFRKGLAELIRLRRHESRALAGR